MDFSKTVTARVFMLLRPVTCQSGIPRGSWMVCLASLMIFQICVWSAINLQWSQCYIDVISTSWLSPPGTPDTMLDYLNWIVFYVTCVLSCLVQAAPNNVVDVGYATYRGNLSYPDVVAYLGIPYAEPPLGEMRFRASLALNTTRVAEQTHGEIVDATTYPDFCVQGTTGSGCRSILMLVVQWHVCFRRWSRRCRDWGLSQGEHLCATRCQAGR